MQRISVIGTSGSGKSTLARRIAQRLRIPCVELDAINWQLGNWKPIATEDFRAQVTEVVRQDRWVVEGGYSAVRPLIWERADTVVWLDYAFPIVFARLIRRTGRRVASREELWGGNRESLLLTLSRDSILFWCIKTHRRNRRRFAAALALPEHRHLRVLRFRSPRQTEEWLNATAKHEDAYVTERSR